VGLGISLPLRRSAALERAAAWRLALGALVLASVVARTLVAWLRATPEYFPDEGIYASLSRSLAAGHLPAVRGHVAHFPALLQPLATAPAWWFGSLETGYRLTQAIDAAAMSCAGLAVWWCARRLGAGRGPAFAAAALTLAVPDAGYSGWLLAESFAYPLFVCAVAAGLISLARPSRRSQSVFLALALLASFARLQLAVLVLAYLVAAAGLRRLRGQRIVLSGCGIAAVAALGGGLGYYRHAPAAFHLVGPAALGRNLLVLAYAGGWIVVPAGLLGLWASLRRARSDEERAFGAFAAAAGVAVLGEAVLYGIGGVTHERYGFYLLPLLFVGVALHASRGWPYRRAHALLAAAMLLGSALVPTAGWDPSHSLVLAAMLKVQALAGSAGDGGLDVAAAAAVFSVLSVALAWKRATAAVAALGVAFCIAASAFATSFEVQNSRNVRAAFLPAGPEWVHGAATVVSAGARTSALEQFFWNRGDLKLALLPDAPAPDVFGASRTRVTSGGRLAGVSGQVVLDEDGVAMLPVARERMNGPWVSARTPQLAAAIEGRYGDGWFAPAGTAHVFRHGRISFTAVAPEAMTLRVAGRTVRLPPRTPTRVSFCARGSFRYAFSKHGYVGFRAVSARATMPVWTPSRACLTR
jgi:hypothetical protein